MISTFKNDVSSTKLKLQNRPANELVLSENIILRLTLRPISDNKSNHAEQPAVQVITCFFGYVKRLFKAFLRLGKDCGCYFRHYVFIDL